MWRLLFVHHLFGSKHKNNFNGRVDFIDRPKIGKFNGRGTGKSRLAILGVEWWCMNRSQIYGRWKKVQHPSNP